MRAREFTINVPITIKINGDGDPEIDVAGNNQPEADDKPNVFMSPQQQEIELKKKELGKDSIAAAQLIDDPEEDEIA